MSCTKCDIDDPKNEAGETYVRVGPANVMIVGCREHLAELIRLYRLGIATDQEAKAKEDPPRSERTYGGWMDD